MSKEELKKITDETLGISSSYVEENLEREFYVYTTVWSITAKQLKEIASKVEITNISVDGYSLMLTVKQ